MKPNENICSDDMCNFPDCTATILRAYKYISWEGRWENTLYLCELHYPEEIIHDFETGGLVKKK